MDPRLVRALAGGGALAAVALAAPWSTAQQNSPAEPPVTAPAPAPEPTQTLPPSGEAENTAAAPAVAPDEAPDIARPPDYAQAVRVEKPILPPRPVRGQVSVLQVLDKVTAETLRFQVPVGGRVRYKTLIVEVKVCETRGADDPQPKPAAYLEVTSDPHAGRRSDAVDRKRVFKGWIFANAPGVNALQHPTYDLWLIACGATAIATSFR